MKKYLSYSSLQEFAACPRKTHYRKHPVTYPPLSRKPSLILGSAIHKTIADLHTQDNPETDLCFDLNFEMVENEINKAPIDWGKRGRDYYVARGRKMAHWYWHLNSDIDLRSSERWFFLQIGGDMHIRGRFDQLIVQDGKLVIRELKSGMKPDVAALEYDPQTLIQALALKQGFVAVDTDIPYISEDEKGIEIHGINIEACRKLI